MSDKKTAKKNDRGATRKKKDIRWKADALRWGKCVMLSIIIVTGVVGVYFVEQEVEESMSWPVSKVSIQGEYKHVKKEELVEMIKPFIGRSFLSVELISIKQRLENEPTIYRAVIERQWPDALIVSIVEQTPFAKWGDGELLNSEGDIFKLTKSFESDGNELPRLVGEQGSAKTVLKAYKKMTKLLATRDIKIESLYSDEKGAYKAMLTPVMELNIGRENIENRVERFLKVYDQQLKLQVERIAAVDLRYNNGIAVSWNKTVAIDSGLMSAQGQRENLSLLNSHLAER